MAATLQDLFDKCPWKEKHQGRYPENPDEIVYQWSEEDVELAEPFFARAGMAVYPEETVVVKRSLYLGPNPDGDLTLAVREAEKSAYRESIPEMARGYVKLIDPQKTEDYMRRLLDDKN